MYECSSKLVLVVRCFSCLPSCKADLYIHSSKIARGALRERVVSLRLDGICKGDLHPCPLRIRQTDVALREVLVDASRDNETTVDQQVDVATIGIWREVLRGDGGSDRRYLSAKQFCYCHRKRDEHVAEDVVLVLQLERPKLDGSAWTHTAGLAVGIAVGWGSGSTAWLSEASVWLSVYRWYVSSAAWGWLLGSEGVRY